MKLPRYNNFKCSRVVCISRSVKFNLINMKEIENMKDNELVARLQQYSQMIGLAQFVNKQEHIEELSGLDMVIADEILKRLTFRHGQTTPLERDLLEELIRPALGTIGKSNLAEYTVKQDLNFRILLENIKNMYKGKYVIGEDMRDWNRLLEDLLD